MSEDLRCNACGELHPNARLIKTEDGRHLALQSEAYTRYCMAKYALKVYRTNRTRQAFLGRWKENKGEAEWSKLREEMLRLYHHRKGSSSQAH